MSKWKLYFDGASRGNPGQSGAGALIIGPENKYEVIKKIGIKTNNQAEYISIKIGLDRIIELLDKYKIAELEIMGDSLLVIKQLKGEYRVKSSNLIPYYQSVVSQLNTIKSRKIKITYNHIRRHLNTKADALANKAIDTL